jgi:ATP-dependent RNA helicase RhlB
MKFTELNLDERVLRGIEEIGFTECTKVQEKTLAATLEGKDVSVQSQTGTGKTAAFLISIMQIFSKKESMEDQRALVIVPTRELAVQIEEEARELAKYLPLKIGSFYGGVGYGIQEASLREGVNLLIGTPGRLIDFQMSGKLDMKSISAIVIDEADRLFDMGFLPDLRKMLKHLPPVSERQTMLFSATLSSRVKNLSWEYMGEAVEIEIEPEEVTVKEINQTLYHVSTNEKMALLLGLLKKIEPSNAILFTNTKHEAVKLAKRLQVNGYSCQYIMGDLPQKKRLRIIERLKSGDLQFLVATDVAARGLHVDDLSLVVNYDVPEDPENYVHRIGRTARAGKSGLAVTLACEKFVYGLEAIEKYAGVKIPVEWADEKVFVEDKSVGMRFHFDHEERGRREKNEYGRNRKQPRNERRAPHHSERTKNTDQEHLRQVQSAVSAAAGRNTRTKGLVSDDPKRDSRRSRNDGGRKGYSNEPREGSKNRDRNRDRNRGRKNSENGSRDSRRPERENRPYNKDRDDSRRGKKPQDRRDRSPRKYEERREGTRPDLQKPDSLEKRLQYYKEKYGDDFKVTDEMLAQDKKRNKASKSSKKGILKKLSGLFSAGKKNKEKNNGKNKKK